MNGYVCFYRGKRHEVHAETSFAAQKLAAAHFNTRETYKVTVVLAERGEEPGVPVVHVADF